MDATEIAFRERYAPEPLVTARREAAAELLQRALPVLPEADPTEDLPLFVSAGAPVSDEAIDRLFTQENGA